MKLKIRDDFYLSSVHPQDKAAYIDYLNEDQTISDAISVIPYPYTEAHADWWIERRLKFLQDYGKEISFAIRDRQDHLIGSIGVDDFQIGTTHRAEVGYWLAKAFRGRGLMTDALAVFVEYAWNNLQLTRLTVHTLDFNHASARVLEKNGFKREGHLRQDERTKKGIFDVFAWGLLKSEWQSPV
jgi:[ribosomal protein S5]-alanine N-acetyltransferase